MVFQSEKITMVFNIDIDTQKKFLKKIKPHKPEEIIQAFIYSVADDNISLQFIKQGKDGK